MDIDKFAFGYCEACIENENQTKICLSCMKLITYEAIREGVQASFPCYEDIEKAIQNGTTRGMGIII